MEHGYGFNMEHGYGPEYHIHQQIKRSRNIVVISTAILFIVFSSSIVMTLLHYGQKETKVLSTKIDKVDTKVDSIYDKQIELQVAVNEVAKQLDESLEDNEDVISTLSTVNRNVNKANTSLDSVVLYIKK